MAATPPSQPENARRQAFLRQASVPVIGAQKPPLVHRWLRANESGKGGWTTTGLRDNRNLEAAWAAMQHNQSTTSKNATIGSIETDDGPSATPGEKAQELKEKGKSSGSDEEEDLILEPPDPDHDLPIWRVPVGEDRMFEVDLRTRKWWPVFWKAKGIDVLRGSWFFDASKISPCANEVAEELESLYHSIKPWLSSYADELKSAVSLGADAEEKLKAPLKSLKSTYVIFLGPSLARIYSDDVGSRMAKTLWTAWSGAHGGGTLVARGYDNARRLLRTRESKRVASKAAKKGGHRNSPSTSSDAALNSSSSKLNLSQGDDGTSSMDGTATSTSGASTPKAANEPGDGGSADLLRSIMTKMGGWKRTSALSLKTQNDIKEAFKEVQKRAQGTDNVLAEQAKRERAGELASAGLEAEEDDVSDQDEEELTAEEEAREEEAELKREEEKDKEPLELVLVWHGIGQKLAEDWKSLDFTLAVSSLRALAHKRQTMSASSDVGGGGLSALGQGRRVQFLPVLWRTALNDFQPPESDSDHHPDEHLTNHFSLDDIFSDTIPLIKQLISGILFDIPLYLSQHKEEILSRVIKESNRIHRLFIQRNSNFIGSGGRTSLIAHSLGAALAVDILSKQPTKCRSFEDLPHPGAELAFDCRNLYLAGSPVALFMWINKAQLIARKGRDLTKNSAIDEALDRSGRWGCLAVDRIFNIFSASDPIGTRLNCTVDATHAKMLSSIPLVRATKSILRTLPSAIEAPAPSTGIFGTWGRSSAINAAMSLSTAKENVADDLETLASPGEVPDGADALFSSDLAKASPSKKNASPAKRVKSAFEEKWKEMKEEREKRLAEQEKRIREAEDQSQIERDRAERRMSALCEFGSVDFVIPLQTSILTNQYMEFLWSHAGYWTDTSFADFLLATLYSDPDRLRQAREKLAKEP